MNSYLRRYRIGTSLIVAGWIIFLLFVYVVIFHQDALTYFSHDSLGGVLSIVGSSLAVMLGCIVIIGWGSNLKSQAALQFQWHLAGCPWLLQVNIGPIDRARQYLRKISADRSNDLPARPMFAGDIRQRDENWIMAGPRHSPYLGNQAIRFSLKPHTRLIWQRVCPGYNVAQFLESSITEAAFRLRAEIARGQGGIRDIKAYNLSAILYLGSYRLLPGDPNIQYIDPWIHPEKFTQEDLEHVLRWVFHEQVGQIVAECQSGDYTNGRDLFPSLYAAGSCPATWDVTMVEIEYWTLQSYLGEAKTYLAKARRGDAFSGFAVVWLTLQLNLPMDQIGTNAEEMNEFLERYTTYLRQQAKRAAAC